MLRYSYKKQKYYLVIKEKDEVDKQRRKDIVDKGIQKKKDREISRMRDYRSRYSDCKTLIYPLST